MIGFGVPSSCLQCISTGPIVLVWKLKKGGTHSQVGHHGAPKLELQRLSIMLQKQLQF
jgi:hypothetical protein